MAVLVVFYSLACFFSGAYAVQLSPQPITSFLVQQGQRVILPFNYSIDLSERDKVLTIGLDLNGDAVLTYVEFKGGIIENRTVGAFIGRGDVKILSSPQTYVGLVIEQTTLNDTGRYTWSITIDATETPGVPLEVIVGNKPGSVSLVYSHEEGMTYRLACTVTGGIPSPNVTILNGTEVIHTSSASTTTTNVTVDFTTVFYCVGTNGLGSTNSSSLQLPIPTTTMSPTTSPVTTTRDNTAPITSKPTDKTQTGNNTANDTDSPRNPPNTALIVGVICGCVGGFFIIVILVCVFKKKLHRTKNGKKVLTLEQRVVEGNDNTCEQQENTTKLSTQQEQEEKQQRNVQGRQFCLGPRGNTKPAGRDRRKKRELKADSNAEDTEQGQEDKQQRNVEGLQYADLDLRPRGKTKPAGGNGGNKLVFNDDSVEYAEVRKM